MCPFAFPLAYRSCRWRHKTFDSDARARFEECTGVRAAEQHLKEWNLIVFILSSLLSPYGMAWVPITKIIENDLADVCNNARWGFGKSEDTKASFDKYFQEFTDTATFREPYRSLKSEKVSTFVIDFLLKPIYNAFRLGGKLGVKPLGNAAKAIRPYLKRATEVDEEVEEFCEKIDPWMGYVRR